MKLKRKSAFRIKQLVAATKHTTATNTGLKSASVLAGVPKGHWLRKYAAKDAWKSRSRLKYGGGFGRGLKSV